MEPMRPSSACARGQIPPYSRRQGPPWLRTAQLGAAGPGVRRLYGAWPADDDRDDEDQAHGRTRETRTA
ncbi:hypothetical protein [Streptomyces scopuliridis]|uniref:hypothetical protein n=1 Tax=Streptomyces scopuliridis TaxID=452529 RepID=UPI00343F5A04